MVVHDDLVGGQTRHRDRGIHHPRRHLRAEPDVAAVGAHMHRAVDRLHRGVREERLLIDGVDARLRIVERIADVAVLARHRAVALRGIGEVVDDLLHRQVRAGAFVPFDLERLHAAFGGPGVVADHRDRVVDPDHLAHAGDLLRVGVVDARERAAEHREIRNRGIDHVGHAHVEPEHGGAIYFLRRIEALGRRVDQLEVLRVALSTCRA
jgi:hypothetical protein